MRIASSEDSQPADPSIPTAEERDHPQWWTLWGSCYTPNRLQMEAYPMTNPKNCGCGCVVKKKKMTCLIFLFVIYLLFNWTTTSLTFPYPYLRLCNLQRTSHIFGWESLRFPRLYVAKDPGATLVIFQVPGIQGRENCCRYGSKTIVLGIRGFLWFLDDPFLQPPMLRWLRLRPMMSEKLLNMTKICQGLMLTHSLKCSVSKSISTSATVLNSQNCVVSLVRFCREQTNVWWNGHAASWNKMQPTNPNAHTYVDGTDVETHGNAVAQNTFLKQFIWTVLYIFPCYHTSAP